jgi:anti-sigma factor (TIGR02949 family)
MISCQEAVRLLYEYLDGELKDLPEEEVRAHFDACQRCFPHLKLEAAFRDAVRRASCSECAPAELRDKLASLISEMDEGC